MNLSNHSKYMVLAALIAGLALSLTFGLGYIFGHNSSPAPIVIEQGK